MTFMTFILQTRSRGKSKNFREKYTHPSNRRQFVKELIPLPH